MSVIQKQVHSYFQVIDGQRCETANCPFCGKPTKGVYTYDGVQVKETCEHSIGFVTVAAGIPVVVFEEAEQEKE